MRMIILLGALCQILAIEPALAADTTSERAQLAMVQRQLLLTERMAEHSAQIVPDAGARYHFDYSRLHADLQRIRIGIDDYLTPRRAQPRDLELLRGDYRQEAIESEQAQP